MRCPSGKTLRISHSSLLYSLTSVAIVLASIWLYRSLAAPKTQSQTIPKLPQDPAIEVYFNHAQSSNFREPHRDRVRTGDDLGAKIIESIDGATTSIDLAVQQFQLPQIAHALAAKAKTGVKVRVVLENSYSRPWSELSADEVAALPSREGERYREFERLVDADGNGRLDRAEIESRDAMVILQRANIPILDDTADGSKGSGLMHHKFMVVDGKTTIVTSANWTMSDIYGDITRPESNGNANNLVRLISVEIARLFTAEFDLMWGDGVGGSNNSLFGINKGDRSPVTTMVGNTPVTVKFSPNSRAQLWEQTTNGTIGGFIDRSHQRIDLALFVFSEDNLGDKLVAKGMQGIKIRGLIDRQFADRDYSQRLKLMGCGAGNKMVGQIDVPKLSEGDLLHHKFAIIDGQTVITGSHNWSAAANNINDEATIIIQNNSTITAHFQREFDRLHQDAIEGISPRVCQK
jgi:phosphatidylserine/phosphatidylglycerophosphate/cardiolipin synthase-like enzyme